MPNFTPKRRPRYGFIPWAAMRHKSRYTLAEQFRREYLGLGNDAPSDLDVIAQMPADARRDLLHGRIG